MLFGEATIKNGPIHCSTASTFYSFPHYAQGFYYCYFLILTKVQMEMAMVEGVLPAMASEPRPGWMLSAQNRLHKLSAIAYINCETRKYLSTMRCTLWMRLSRLFYCRNFFRFAERMHSDASITTAGGDREKRYVSLTRKCCRSQLVFHVERTVLAARILMRMVVSYRSRSFAETGRHCCN